MPRIEDFVGVLGSAVVRDPVGVLGPSRDSSGNRPLTSTSRRRYCPCRFRNCGLRHVAAGAEPFRGALADFDRDGVPDLGDAGRRVVLSRAAAETD